MRGHVLVAHSGLLVGQRGEFVEMGREQGQAAAGEQLGADGGGDAVAATIGWME
jgi:hypothetical protein